jgi:hypothetical protein
MARNKNELLESTAYTNVCDMKGVRTFWIWQAVNACALTAGVRTLCYISPALVHDGTTKFCQ